MAYWRLVDEPMSDEISLTIALGYFGLARMQKDYELIEPYFKIDTSFDIKTAYTNEYFDCALKMTK